ncbi:MAG: AAA family ATPase [Candidatus Pacebacteria bacterium]|nr:AAA family ATPase [Candidatus Paceibacterota bacterium]
MKFEKFNKINTASFKNFTWPSELKKFEKVNIILGWNGSGKTILSRILRSFEKGSINNLPNNSQFSITIDSQNYNQDSLNETFIGQIRVFNEDYIAEMMSQGSFPYIIYVGEDPVDYSKKEQLIGELTDKQLKIKCIDKYTEVAEKIAKQIRLNNGIGNVQKELESGYYNSYNKASFEKRIEDFTNEIKNGKTVESFILEEDTLKSLQEQLYNQETKQSEFTTVKKWNDWITDNLEKINNILSATPVHEKSERITRYQEESDIYNWIRDGVEIHKLSDEKSKHSICLFCNSPIRNSNELLKHFTNDILRLNSDVSDLLSKMTEANSELNNISKFYQQQVITLKESITIIKTKLELKQKNFIDKIDDVSFNDLFIGKSADILPLKDVAHQVEKHFVAEVYMAYLKIKNEYDICVQQENELKQKIKNEKEELLKLKAKAKNVHTPADKLSELLKVTFPYKQIELRDTDDEIGYEIYRGGEKCNFNTLSEGERNFIALAYFLTAINTQEESKKIDENGLVVIDDPVSSLDKHSIFQIFSILANEVERNISRQYIFLTHNLDFFSHLCHHYKEEDIPYYQVFFDKDGSKLDTIHKMLRNFKSDYQYSVSILWNKKDDCTLEDAYHMVNLLRRVWETLLYFKFGHGQCGLKNRLEQAYNVALEEQYKMMTGAKQDDLDKKRDQFNTNCLAMYRFVNYGSHEFSSTDSFDVSVLSDASRRISDFFSVLKLLDKHHYDNVTNI